MVMKQQYLSEEERRALYQQIASLTPDQKRAVMHNSGPLLVIAGAGSGKTRVATLRLSRLIAEGVSPQEIIGVTFTNKAAREMKERVYALVGSSVQISTFHSLGAKILREFSYLLDYPSNFVIYDEDDREKLLKSCLKRAYKSDKALPSELSDISQMISSLKNSTNNVCDLSEEMKVCFTSYQEELKKASAFDFDDLQYQTLQLLKNHEEVRAKLALRWKYLLIDEYQDTNDVQCEIAFHLIGPEKNIFAVGDPDQSIYSWRGANLEHILAFKDRFLGAQEVRLEKNYRSTNTILSAANAVIQHNQNRLEKSLWSDRGEGAKLLCHVARGDREEAEYVVSGIDSLIKNKNHSLSEIAILYRTNAQSRSFEDFLIRKRIPYVIWGGLSFYQRREIKDVLAFARLSVMPQDIIAFERVVNIPKRGIGGTTLEKISRYVSEREIPIVQFIKDLVSAQFDCTKFSGLEISLNAKQKSGLIQFCDVLNQLQRAEASKSAFQLISSAMHDTGYLAYLEAEEDENYIDRRENLEQLIAKAIEWDQEWEKIVAEGSGSNDVITRFFETLTLETAVQESLSGAESITLATVHNAKGLEFQTVFLVGLEEDLFPHINVKFQKNGKDPSNQEIEEERRLMYVGMTRAKDLLSVSLAQNRLVWGSFRTMRPSRFLYEIPGNLLQKVSRFPER